MTLSASNDSQSAMSEYERERLENIRRNQELLSSLHLNPLKLSENVLKKSTTTPIKSSVRKPKSSMPPKSHRMSTRSSMRTSTGSPLLEGTLTLEQLEAKLAKKPSWQETKEQTTSLEMQNFRLEGINVIDAADATLEPEAPAKLQNIRSIGYKEDSGLIKVLRSRIYSMAWHPNIANDLFICFAGDKDGNLAVLNVKEWRETADSMAPHGLTNLRPSKETISNLKFSPVDSNKLYMSCYDGTIRTMDLATQTISVVQHMPTEFVTAIDFAQNGTLFYSTGSGGMGVIDERQRPTLNDVYEVHEKKTQCISVNWTHENVFCTSSLDNTVCLWDMRTMPKNESPIAFKTLTHRRSVTSAYFHHSFGDKLVTTCYDDYVRYYDSAVTSAIDQPHTVVHHNNQTGKWITTFKATWDNCTPCYAPYFIIGDMPKTASIFDGETGRLVQRLDCDYLTAQPAVNAVHPKLATLVCSGTAAGKVAIWS